jgi:5-methyltetrahydrofolate--homocysteine methyltransferase
MMEKLMPLKPDAAEAADRMSRWWRGEPTDRVVASITAPRSSVPDFRLRGTIAERLLDADTVIHNLRATAEARYWGGEAFPAYWIFPIAVPMSVYLGCTPQFGATTTWQLPAFDTWDGKNWRSVRFDPENHWWKIVCDLSRRLAEEPDLPFLLSACGLGGISDVMANLWGSETLLTALIDDPEGVHGQRNRLIEDFRTMYDRLYEIVSGRQHGYFDWLMLWAPGRMCTSQSDISCMMSSTMFSEFFIEEIRQEARHVDYYFYHLDGPGAIRHLNALLDIDELDGIQWVPGAGASRDPMDWIELFKRIQDRGKKLFISCPPERVTSLLKVISRRGVYLSISCDAEAIARETLSTLERLGP